MVAADERRVTSFMFTDWADGQVRASPSARYATGTARGVGRCSVGAEGEVRLIRVPVENSPTPCALGDRMLLAIPPSL